MSNFFSLSPSQIAYMFISKHEQNNINDSIVSAQPVVQFHKVVHYPKQTGVVKQSQQKAEKSYRTNTCRQML